MGHPAKKSFRSTIVKAIVKVDHGRGFVIEHRVEYPPFKGRRRSRRERIVITAAHCLPQLPISHSASSVEHRTYENLLGSLTAEEPNIWAECLFADPISDIAVLTCADRQDLEDQANAYDALTKETMAIRVAEARLKGRAWLLALDGKWFSCTVDLQDHGLYINSTDREIKGGMSGSPILNDDGAAVGVICMTAESVAADSSNKFQRSGPQPVLLNHLPVWIADACLVHRVAR